MMVVLKSVDFYMSKERAKQIIFEIMFQRILHDIDVVKCCILQAFYNTSCCKML